MVGANGQGKTSFLEALSFLSTLRSFRGAKAHEIIQWGQSAAEATCLLSTADEAEQRWETELKISFSMVDLTKQKATKVAFINGKPYRSSTQYLSQRFGSFELGFHTVVFNPADHDLIRGEPSVRRGYLDRVIAANDLEYLKTLQKFQRVLEQRNAILKNAERPAHAVLEGFTDPLARYAAELTLKRLMWIEKVAQRINDMVRKVTSEQRLLRVFYASSWAPKIEGLSLVNDDFRPLHFTGHGPLPSLELLEQAFRKKASNLEAAEWRAGHSLVGPQRDDWMFFLGDQPLKGHGSQGEIRSTLLALKISEIELFRSSTGHRPLFLLDDFSSELDQERRRFLLRYLSETDLQVFVTATEETSFEGRLFKVSSGSLTEGPGT